jgi:hypothetical protein
MKCYFFLVSFIFCLCLSAQNAYFQQHLDYTIHVRLDDKNHSLSGNIEIIYKNNSPDILDKIGMHLWPNAYAHKQTAFARQKLNHQDTRFYDALPSDLGYIDSLNFKVDGTFARLEIDIKNPDMAWLHLPEVLLPGHQIIIHTPFFVKIPESFSRLGHAGQTYQITQWYPKPAVYDHKGWHLMPYLDQGEFYSEFGNFNVTISLPKNYVVAATGSLQNIEEKKFLNQRITETNRALQNGIPVYGSTPESDAEFKTLHYKAENVHDFAWFADKTFYVQKTEAILQSGKLVECWTMFNNPDLWNESVSYVKRAIEFYSDHIGEYPWPHATAVESALSAGGGMEYPMITVIGQSYSKEGLDEVITHEVGHNWFYGILASNERDYPFLDEGINTYYQFRYMKQYYPNSSLFYFPDYFTKLLGTFEISQIMYLIFAREYNDQYPNQHSENFTPLNYGNDVYFKTAQLFSYADYFMGTSVIDSLMRQYYNAWKFKHPYPEDLRDIFKDTEDYNLSWLFDGFLNSNGKMDYSFTSIEKNREEYILEIKNKGNIPAPFTVSAIKNGKEILSYKLGGFTGKEKISLYHGDYDYFAIDYKNKSYDLYDCNNYIRTRGLFKKLEPVKFHLIPILGQNGKTDIGLTPILGKNYYNGLMAGFYLSGPLFPYRKFNFSVLPFYSFRSGSLAGQTELRYTYFLNSGIVKNVSALINAKTYSYNHFSPDVYLNYVQIQPEFEVAFRHKPVSLTHSSLLFTIYWIRDELLQFHDSLPYTYSLNRINYQLSYNYNKKSVLGDFNAKVSLNYFQHAITSEVHQKLVRLQLSCEKLFRYKNNRYFSIRSYLAWYPYNTERHSNYVSSRSSPNFYRGSTGLSFQNYLDEYNEELFLGRSESSGIWSQQIAMQQGGFKLVHGVQQRSNLGNSNHFIWSVNFSSDLPFKYFGKRLRPYLDIGYFEQDGFSNRDKILISAGINLNVIPGIFDLYLPVFHSRNINDLYNSKKGHTYLNEISFSIKIKKPGITQILPLIGF